MTLAQLLLGQGLIFDTTALAAVALLGYLFGRRTSRATTQPADVTLLIELARAQCVAKDLEHLTQRLRTESQGHLAALAAFQGQVELMQRGSVVADWRQLKQHADALMGPTMALVSSLAVACDEMRDQQSQLMTFAESRVDRETGVLNRRALLEHLQARLSARGEGMKQISLVLCSVDVDPYESAVGGGGRLANVARLIEQYARNNDLVARYGPQEFVVLLPRTTLDGGLVVGERILKVVDASFERRVWGGIVEAEIDETPEELLARAESALRAAAREEISTLFIHDGAAMRRHAFEVVGAHRDRLAVGAVNSEEDGGDLALESIN
jgi:diguanylate cyclase (GGDEF)-like protein